MSPNSMAPACFPHWRNPPARYRYRPSNEPSRYRDVMYWAPQAKPARHNDRDRITAERRERTELIAEEERQRQAWLAANEPPPF